MWWNTVPLWNSDGRLVLVEQCWWNSGTVIVKQCCGTVMVEQCWWNSETVIVEQWSTDGGKVLVEQ